MAALIVAAFLAANHKATPPIRPPLVAMAASMEKTSASNPLETAPRRRPMSPAVRSSERAWALSLGCVRSAVRATGAAVSAVEPSDKGTMQASNCGNEDASGMATMEAHTNALPPTMASSRPKRSDTMAIGCDDATLITDMNAKVDPISVAPK